MDGLVTEKDDLIRGQRQDDRFIAVGIEGWGVLLGEIDLEALDQHWRSDDEDDQQDQHHIHERRNVDLREIAQVFPTYLHSHRRLRSKF